MNKDTSSATRYGAPGEACGLEAGPKSIGEPGAAGGSGAFEGRKAFKQRDASFKDGYGRRVGIALFGWEPRRDVSVGDETSGCLAFAIDTGCATLHLRPTPEQARRIAEALIAAADSFDVPTCGKVCNGVPCSMPAGSVCPDCGPAVHDVPEGS